MEFISGVLVGFLIVASNMSSYYLGVKEQKGRSKAEIMRQAREMLDDILRDSGWKQKV